MTLSQRTGSVLCAMESLCGNCVPSVRMLSYILRRFGGMQFYFLCSGFVYRVYVKGLYKFWGRVIHSKTMHNVHMNMCSQQLPFRVKP
jgi:hypothetical protein